MSAIYKTIRVIPINMETLNAELDKSVKSEINKAGESIFAPKLEPNEIFKMNYPIGVIAGTTIVINNECIVKGLEEKIKLDIFSECKVSEKSTTFSVFPRFSSTVSVEELIKDHGMDEVSLDVFMGERFAYNHRIESNMFQLKQQLKF